MVYHSLLSNINAIRLRMNCKAHPITVGLCALHAKTDELLCKIVDNQDALVDYEIPLANFLSYQPIGNAGEEISRSTIEGSSVIKGIYVYYQCPRDEDVSFEIQSASLISNSFIPSIIEKYKLPIMYRVPKSYKDKVQLNNGREIVTVKTSLS